MKSSKPLFVSLAFHALLFMVAWGAFSTLRKIPEPEKVRIAVLLQTPMSTSSTPQPITQPKPIDPTPVKTPLIPAPIETSNVLSKTPVPILAKPVQPPVIAQAPTPAVAKIPIAEPVVVKAPPPPPLPVNVQATYEEENLGRIRSLLSDRLKYPRNALRLRQQGTTVVTFSLSPSGEVSGITISKSSDFEMLDDAARELIESTAALFPKPSKSVRISVPIEYKIR